MSIRASLALLIAATSMPAHAQGKPTTWAPVLVDVPDAAISLALVTRMTARLRTSHSAPILEPAAAAVEFETDHSLPPHAIELDVLKNHAAQVALALERAHVGDWAKAAEHASAFGQLPHVVQDLVRSTDAQVGQDLLDYCLKVAEHRSEQQGAEAELAQCIRRVPNRRPGDYDAESPRGHLYTAVRAKIPTARIDLDVPADCAIYVNGEPRKLPLDTLDVRQRVQLRCAERVGRIYDARPGALEIDHHLDRVVQTGPQGLRLRYADLGEASEHQVEDALAVAAALKATNLLLVSRSPTGRVVFSRIDTKDGSVVAEVSVARDASTSELRKAAAIVAAAPEPLLTPRQKPQPLAPDGNSGLVPGLALTVGAAASYTVAWGLYAEQLSARNRFVDQGPCLPETSPDSALYGCILGFQKYSDAGRFSVFSGVFGASLGSAAVVTLVPADDGVPLWSWLVGGAGVSVAVVGGALWNSGDDCTMLQPCDPDGHDESVGQLVMLQAAPLVAIPLTYVVRGWLGGNATVTAETGPSAGRVLVRGAF